MTRALPWRIGTVVVAESVTARHRRLVLDVPEWPGHLPGQHIAMRLTAEDGYSTQRDYSIAAPTDGVRVELGVSEADDGEVSSYLAREVRPGDRLELRGPVGGYFVWDPRRARRPALLVGGGSGVVPLRAILLARVAGSRVPMRLVCSVRSPADAPYAAQFEDLAGTVPGIDLTWTYTRDPPRGWRGRIGRVDEELLGSQLHALAPGHGEVDLYVCGPTAMVEAVATALTRLGQPAALIRTERFG